MSKKSTAPGLYDISDPPERLSNNPTFWGLTLDEDQKIFADAIWNNDVRLVMCEACAGSGKTTIAVGAGEMLYRYFGESYDKIVYVMHPYGEKQQGYIPGGITQKSVVYFQPLWDALVALDINPYSVVCNDSLNGLDTFSKDDYFENDRVYSRARIQDPHIYSVTDTFFRGINLKKSIVIFDEAQNYSLEDLRKCLTRCHDDCKVIVIGQFKQRDISNASGGFETYFRNAEAYEGKCDWLKTCELTYNHRGFLSTWADNVQPMFKSKNNYI